MNFFCALFFRRLAAGFCILFFLASAFAQSQDSTPTRPSRYLFIFETSPTMKRCQPAVETILKSIFFDSLRGHLHDDDQIGVWTVDEKLHSGQFPLTAWSSANASPYAEALKTFLDKQPYSSPGNLGALTASLTHVVENSERLTIFIFCDGESGIVGTPFDFAIQRIFNEAAGGQKKMRQPFVIVMRAQRGKYVGANVTLAPNTLNVPDFPPLPKPPVAAPAVKISTNQIVHPTNVVVPSLIIIGTNVGTDLAAMTEFEKTNVPAPVKTNPVVLPATNILSATNTVSTNKNVAVSLSTNVLKVVSHSAAPKSSADDFDPEKLLWITGAATALVVALIISLTIRSRRPRGSLITGSMNQPRPPPRRK